jgi:transposase
MEPGNNYRGNARGTNSDEAERRAQAELMWDDRIYRHMTNAQIAKKYNVGERTVTNRFKEFPKENYDRTQKADPSGGRGNEIVRMSEAAEMWEMKKNHRMSNEQLAEHFGVSITTVKRRLSGFFPEKPVVALEAYRQRELESLESLEDEAMRLMNETTYVVDKGAVVAHPKTGEPLVDLSNKFQAIETIRKLIESKRKLLGLDAPVKTEVTHNTGVEIQVDEIQEMVDKAKKKQEDRERELKEALGQIVDAEIVEDENEQ